MNPYLITILLALAIVGCETQSTAVGPATGGSTGGSKSASTIATTSYVRHPMNPMNQFTPCNVEVVGKTFAGQWSQTSAGVEVVCFGSDGVCFTVNNCNTIVINESSGGSGGMGGTGYNVLEGP